MDKIGPICRSVEDCAVVFGAIHGADGRDQTAVNQPYQWPANVNLRGLRVGVIRRENADSVREESKLLEELGCKLVEIELPKDYPLRAMIQVIDVEGAATFGELLRAGQTEGWNDWTNIFRAAHFMSAVDYLKIMRVRRKLMLEMEQVMSQIDVMFNCSDLLHTNLTGHPSVILPWRVTEREGLKRPQSVIFTGHLFDESRVLALAHAFQRLVDGHLQRPPLDSWLEQFNAGTLDAPPDKKPGDPPQEAKSGDKPPTSSDKDK
jgi:Asp-tRNA(Asn)/Glu-tRNA(Gln) amidotransferase A subunit family amidase